MNRLDEARRAKSGHDAALWAGVLAGPLAWASNLGISYAIVKWTCGSRHTIAFHAITIGALIVIGAGAVPAWSGLDRARAAGVSGERIRFMARWGLLSCAFFALVVVATSIPAWVLNACQ